VTTKQLNKKHVAPANEQKPVCPNLSDQRAVGEQRRHVGEHARGGECLGLFGIRARGEQHQDADRQPANRVAASQLLYALLGQQRNQPGGDDRL
jgi:hypothetical protein